MRKLNCSFYYLFAFFHIPYRFNLSWISIPFQDQNYPIWSSHSRDLEWLISKNHLH